MAQSGTNSGNDDHGGKVAAGMPESNLATSWGPITMGGAEGASNRKIDTETFKTAIPDRQPTDPDGDQITHGFEQAGHGDVHASSGPEGIMDNPQMMRNDIATGFDPKHAPQAPSTTRWGTKRQQYSQHGNKG